MNIFFFIEKVSSEETFLLKVSEDLAVICNSHGYGIIINNNCSNWLRSGRPWFDSRGGQDFFLFTACI